MGFTVIRPEGATDRQFETYTRLLRRTGVDIGKLPRVRDPITGKRWLHWWNTQSEAQAFADELHEGMGQNGWKVIEVDTPPSEGPLGPVVIQLARRRTGLILMLHPQSEALLGSAFPAAFRWTTVSLDADKWEEYRQQDCFSDLVRLVAPALTGLTNEKLEELGYTVVDDLTEETVLFVPPAVLVQG